MSSSGQDELQHRDHQDDRDQARDLERVTDYAEEPEMNVENMSSVMSIFEQEERGRQASAAAREREIQRVKIDKAHVQLVMEQMDVDVDLAERVLKENDGDPGLALKALLHRRLLV